MGVDFCLDIIKRFNITNNKKKSSSDNRLNLNALMPPSNETKRIERV